MKGFKRYIFIVLVIALASCQQDFTTNNGGGYTTLSVTLDNPHYNSRTSLGEKVDGTYRVHWSDGDRIAVNGWSSRPVQINTEDYTKATFEIDGVVNGPYKITYPYTPTTAADAPKVVFPAEQSFVEGSFDKACAPMSGYSKKGQSITLSHLAGIFRLPVKAKEEGITLKSIVITSADAKLAGEFDVDCQNAVVSPTKGATNSIIYTINRPLSTSTESVFYIALPMGETGACTIEFIDSNGSKMTGLWGNKEVNGGVVYEFRCATYETNSVVELRDLDSEDGDLFLGDIVIGDVTDTKGNPIAGVAVSDGFSVVKTDAKGHYTLPVSTDAWYIYISTPSEYKVPLNSYGLPCFYKRYSAATRKYNFTLTPLAEGKESEFALFAIGDPQILSDNNLLRLQNEAIPGIKRHYEEVATTGLPCYGITLGDLIFNNERDDTSGFRDDIRDLFAESKTGMPVFHVMGNHDNNFFNIDNPLTTDSTTPSLALMVQRDHEEMFGPINYSFNRGDVHIVGMRNIIYTSNTIPGSFKPGFTFAQYEWLKSDLALVPKDKMVVLCVHIPLLTNKGDFIPEVISLLKEFDEAHIMSGHSHIVRNYEHTTTTTSHKKIYEHNSGALCGAWWCSNMCSDGAPNGFQVFKVSGNTIEDWYYTGYHNGMNSRDHQMRLYRGNAVTGGPISGSNTYKVKGYYAFNFAEDVLLANVYNADSSWSIKVYEDGEYSGDMQRIPTSQPAFDELIGSYTLTDPRRAAVETSHDMYVAGLFLGVLGRYSSKGLGSGSWSQCYHLYKYKLKNKDADIKVIATDRFGKEYIEERITSGTDYSKTKKP